MAQVMTGWKIHSLFGIADSNARQLFTHEVAVVNTRTRYNFLALLLNSRESDPSYFEAAQKQRTRPFRN